MKNYFWNIKIPTYLGIALLILTLTLTIFFLQRSGIRRLRAIFPNTPASVTLTNISASSFTISYLTSDPATGTVSYGENVDAGQIINDDKDIDLSVKPYKIHYFTVNNLKPDTTYYFNILSDNTVFDNNGSPYVVKTAKTLTPTSQTAKNVQGKVILPDGNSPAQAIVFIKSSDSQLLSTQVKPDGTYSISLNNLHSKDLATFLELTDSDSLNLDFKGDGMTATANVLVKDSMNVPLVTLSQEYNFATESNLSPTLSTSEAAQITLPQFSKTTPADKLDIIIPEKNQPFTDQQPELSGTGIPDSVISISIQAIEVITDEVTADSSGLWTYRPDQKLEPGVYTLTINGKDKNGRAQSVSESFVIYAEGSRFTDPSVAPQKTPTTAISPTLTPSITTPTPTLASASPSATIIPTFTPTLTPTNTVIPTLFTPSTISPQPNIPDPGSNELFISIGLITFATVVSAMLFLLFRV